MQGLTSVVNILTSSYHEINWMDCFDFYSSQTVLDSSTLPWSIVKMLDWGFSYKIFRDSFLRSFWFC